MPQISEDLRREFRLAVSFIALERAADGAPAAGGRAWLDTAMETLPSCEEFEARLLPICLHASAGGEVWKTDTLFDPDTSVVVGGGEVIGKLLENGYSLADEDVVVEGRIAGNGRVPMEVHSFGETVVIRVA